MRKPAPSSDELYAILTGLSNRRQRAKAVAASFNVCLPVARRWLRERGISLIEPQVEKPIKLSLPAAEIISRYILDNMAATAIAAEYGVSYQTIYRLLRKNGVKIRTNYNKIPTKRRVEILNLYRSSDKTQSEIADLTGVDQTTIQKWMAQDGYESKPPGRASAIERWLQQQLGEDFRSDRKTMGFELDLYSPTHQLAIEMCGMYWHSEQRGYYPKNYHHHKHIACREKGIQLLTIFEDEWLSSRDLVLSIIKSKLGKFDRRIQARKCKVTSIPVGQAKAFCDIHHIQGGCQSTEAAGLFYQDDLVGTMTLNPHHRGLDIMTLNRLCFLPNTQIVGGASKLLSFIRRDRPLVSWSDNRWSDGKVYEALGFRLDREYGPDYSYTNNRIRRSKQSFRKSATGCPKEETERYWAAKHGWWRMWDCGKKRWIIE